VAAWSVAGGVGARHGCVTRSSVGPAQSRGVVRAGAGGGGATRARAGGGASGQCVQARREQPACSGSRRARAAAAHRGEARPVIVAVRFEEGEEEDWLLLLCRCLGVCGCSVGEGGGLCYLCIEVI
jgi:hypothetical protein